MRKSQTKSKGKTQRTRKRKREEKIKKKRKRMSKSRRKSKSERKGKREGTWSTLAEGLCVCLFGRGHPQLAAQELPQRRLSIHKEEIIKHKFTDLFHTY